MIAIPAGSLNRRVTLLTPNAGRNPKSGDPLPPAPYANVWASVRPMSGAEIYRAQQFTDQATILVGVRYRPDIAASMTIAYGLRTFEVLAILNELEANVQLNLLCKELQVAAAPSATAPVLLPVGLGTAFGIRDRSDGQVRQITSEDGQIRLDKP